MYSACIAHVLCGNAVYVTTNEVHTNTRARLFATCMQLKRARVELLMVADEFANG